VYAHDSLKDRDAATSTTEQKKGNYEEKRHCTNSLNNNIWEKPIQNIQKSTVGREKRGKHWGKQKKMKYGVAKDTEQRESAAATQR